ncbi:hypothetical protein [Devosia sp.]|uniref:DUF6950 family protein n=1 Tax=Devosia sp. TaxID=1871048 RepID=UPI001ACC4D6A|nr:hypothetical protein [Devosia sp.]MBN9335619.1 hypothetical protein [Devosia sp.]
MTSPAIWTPKPIGPRLPGWENKALAVLNQHMAEPLTWGVSDCLSVPADLCFAMTGVSILPRHLRRYRTEAGAWRLLVRAGFSDVEEALNAAFPRLEGVAMARRFDAGVVERKDPSGRTVLATVIITNGAQAVGRDAEGPVLVSQLSLRAAFAIGARAQR